MEHNHNLVPIKRALLSVSDKDELIALARILADRDVELIASGGTAKKLEENGFQVTPIQKITGNPEAFGGRMKTLSFQVSSSLLYRRNNESDVNEAKELGIVPIDLVVCNLYPYREALKTYQKDENLDSLIENIDVGGPTMVRSAAKNFSDVCVLTDPSQYIRFFEEFRACEGATGIKFRKLMAALAFRHLSRYDTLVAGSLGAFLQKEVSPYDFMVEDDEKSELRYGENPQQRACVVPTPWQQRGLVATTPIQGKNLSYNNYLDADAALRTCRDLIDSTESSEVQAVSIVKHLNPCGASLIESGEKETQLQALEAAWSGDPVSSFGSIISFSKALEGETAKWISKKFVEIILAPSFTSEALEILSAKKNLRLLEVNPRDINLSAPVTRSIDGGWLLSEEDTDLDSEVKTVTERVFDLSQGLVNFGVAVTKHLKSNAISLVAYDEKTLTYQLIGAGMGNPNRLVSLEQAVQKAKENGVTDLSRTLLVSDAFFPFDDAVKLGHQYGIKYFVQPGGSRRDSDVVKTCNELGLSMAITERRHFRH